MIPFDFEYYKPDSIKEAVQLFQELDIAKKEPMYYGGGTEIISMSRAYNIHAGAMIDIKGIPECNVQEIRNDILTVGSAATLTNIAEVNYFPLLGLTVQRIADHTIQDKITLGGNIAGTIIYREAVLPLLISDSEVVIAGVNGARQLPIKDLFFKRINLNRGEFIVQIVTNKRFLSLPYAHVKRTKNEKIDYPLITIAALKDNEKINIAFSGLCEYPFRSSIIEQILSDKTIPKNIKINNAIDNIPDKILNDLSGAVDYRKFMLERMLSEILEKFGGVS